VVPRLGELRELAPVPDGVVLVRHRLVRRVRNLLQKGVACRLRLRQLRLEPLQLVLHPLELLDLLRRRLARHLLPAAQVVHLRDEGAPAFVDGQELVEGLRAALARDGGANGVGIVAGDAQVDHGRESRNA
jgi:hypothetical protein